MAIGLEVSVRARPSGDRVRATTVLLVLSWRMTRMSAFGTDLREATWSQRLIGAGFVLAGVLHFVIPGTYTAITPDYLPAHLMLVLISGAAEFVGGVGMFFPRWRRAAGTFLILLLIAVFPANLHMALNRDESAIPDVLLWARLPLQVVLIGWVYRASGQRSRAEQLPTSAR